MTLQSLLKRPLQPPLVAAHHNGLVAMGPALNCLNVATGENITALTDPMNIIAVRSLCSFLVNHPFIHSSIHSSIYPSIHTYIHPSACAFVVVQMRNCYDKVNFNAIGLRCFVSNENQVMSHEFTGPHNVVNISFVHCFL